MRLNPGTAAALLTLLMAAAMSPRATAHEAHRPAAAPAGPPMATLPAPGGQGGGTRDARTYFTDLELQSQDGRRLRFYSDVLEGRTVLINVIFANCQDACPLITQKLNEVRGLLGDQIGREVTFVTLTSDPKRDTPAALKAYAQKQGVDTDGWLFLSGDARNVEHILKKLGQLSRSPEEHSTLLIAGNVSAKRWTKIRPDAAPVAIADRLKLLAAGGDGLAVPLPMAP